MEVAKVTSIEGTFFIKDANGDIKKLQIGDSISEGSVVFGDDSNTPNQNIVVSLHNDVTAKIKGNDEQAFDSTMTATAHGDEEMSFSLATVDMILRNGDEVDVVSDLREAEFNDESLVAEFDGNEDENAEASNEEDEEVLDEEAAEGEEEEEGGDLNLNFQFRDGNTVDVISDLREREFAVRSQDYEDEGRFENESEGRLSSQLSGTRYTDLTPPPTPTPPSTPTPEPTAITPPPNGNISAPASVLTLEDVTILEGTGTAVIQISVDNAPFTPLNVTLSNGATATIPAGATTTTSTPFAIQGDDVYIDNESYVVSVSSTNGGNYASLTTTDTATVTINDTLDTTTLTLEGDIVVNEGSTANYTLKIDNSPQTDLSITVRTEPLDASSDVDFESIEQVLVIKAGETEVSFTVDTVDDFLSDNGEQYKVVIDESTISENNFEKIVVNNDTVTTTILDNSNLANENIPHEPNNPTNHNQEDDKEIISIKLFAADKDGNVLKDSNGNYLQANEVYEGEDANYIAYAFEEGETTFNDATKLNTQNGTVDISFTDGTATGGNSDYDSSPKTSVTIGQSFNTSTVIDAIAEGSENYTVRIDNNSYSGDYESVQIDTNPVTTTLKDAKLFVKIEAVDSEANESEDLTYKISIVNGAGVPVEVPVGKEIKVNLTYGGDTLNPATQGDDYTSVAQVTIMGGNSETTLTIPTIDDYYAEGDEGLKITIDSIDNSSNAFDEIYTHTQANGAPSDEITTTGTIKDNPSKTKQPTDENNTDEPTNGSYDEDDTIYAIIVGPESVNEGDTTTEYTVKLVDKDGNPVIVTEETDVTVTFTNNTTEDGDTEYNNNDIITITIPVGESSNTFTVNTIDDKYQDNAEVYNLEITDVENTGEFENVKIGDKNGNYKDVDTTIYDNTTSGTETDIDPVKIVLVSVAAATTTIADITDTDGKLIIDNTNSTPETGKLYYMAVAVDSDGKPLSIQDGNVTLDVSNGSAVGGTSTNPLKDGSEDYDSSLNTTTVNIGNVFEIQTNDDYLAEDDENFTVKITDQSGTSYESPSIDTNNDTVTSTIQDNPAKTKQPTDENNTDEPTNGSYDEDDTVYVKIIDNASVIEGNDLVHHIQLVDKDGNVVTIPTGETITLTLTYNTTTGTITNGDFENGSNQYTENSTITVTLDENTPKDSNGIYKLPITNEIIDDFVAEGDEVYTLTITDVNQSGAFENVAIHATDDSVIGTITDGVSLGVPDNAQVDEDGLSDGSQKYVDTQSLDITANGDTYSLSFDTSMTVTDKTSGGEAITYHFSNSNKMLTAKANGEDVFTVELNNDDTYTFTLLKPMDHEYGNNGKNDFDIPFDFTVTSNGTTSPAQTFNVTVVDSIPNAVDKTVEVDEDSSVVIRLADDDFKDGEITIDNGDGNGNQVYQTNDKIDIFDPNDNTVKIGELTNNGDGTLTFEPIDDYSNYNDKPSFTYTVTDLDGDTSTATVEITVNPITDAPDVTVNNVTAYEDAATFNDVNTGNNAEGSNDIPLGLTLPGLSDDQTDENTNGHTGDNPERNGYIELKFTNGGNVSGAVLEKADGTDLETINSNNQTIKIYISDLGTDYHHADLDPGADGAIQLTQAEYEALKIVHAEDNDRDIQINIGVTSYEVDDSNEPLAGVSGEKDDATMTVVIKPVTDDIALTWDTATNGTITQVDNTGTGGNNNANNTFTFDTVDEDAYFDAPIDLKALLTKTSGYENDASGDLDGSEKRTYTIEGIPEGSVVTLGGQSATAGANGIATIEFNNTNNKDADPEFSLKLPEFYSGTITNAKITLSVQDKGMKHNGSSENSGDWGEVKTEEVYFNITVNPVANQATLQIAQAFGLEDAGRENGNTTNNAQAGDITDASKGIELNIKVSSDDTDESETFNVSIDDIPNSGALYVFDQSLDSGNGDWVLVDKDSGNSGNLTVTDNGDGTWKIVIEDFQNDKLPKFIPPHNSDEDYTFKINSKTVDGSDESDWLTSDKDMKVIVKDVADVPEGIDLNSVNLNGQTYAITLDENADLDDGNNKFDLKDVYNDSTALDSYDSDGSETLSVVISNLTSGFGVEGASLIGSGVWTFLADDINNVKITTPANFSGEASFELKYVTTEDAGDSKTHHTDTVNIFVSPTAEATINATTTANEDVLQKVDFSISHQNGDTDETLEEIRIKVDDVEGKEFTLYTDSNGTTPLSNMTTTEIAGVDYYVLTAAQANNIYAKNTDTHKHGTYTFEVGYTVKDSETDQNTSHTIDGTINNYTLTINAVTDAPTAEITTIDDSHNDVSVSGTTVTISAEDSTFTVPVKVTSPDTDGSEDVTQYLISGVPMGVEVTNGTYYGYAGSPHNGIWLLDIADTAINDANGYTQNITFKVNQGADFENRDIKITAYTQDEGASVENDSVTFRLEKSYTASGTGTGTPPEFVLNAQETTINEDEAFNLGSALGVSGNGDHGDSGFAVTITDLPEGTVVNGASYSYVENGVTRYVISGTGGNAADVETALSSVTITPPANVNDSDNSTKSMTFTATIATHHNGTFHQGNTINYSEHILPVTDDMTITVNASDTNEDIDTNFSVTLTNDADGVNTQLIGGKLYIKLSEDYENSGETAEGELWYNGAKLTDTEVVDGDTYFVVDINSYTMGNDIDFTFKPGTDRHGEVSFDVLVQNKEGHTWGANHHTVNGFDTDIQDSTASKTITVSPVIDGFDQASVNDSSGDESTGGIDNRIKIDMGASLTDPSESIGSATLDKIPNGFLIFYGSDVNNLTIATNTGNSLTYTGDFTVDPDGDATTVKYNQWLIPLSGGQLPNEIWIQAPQNWSGTLDDMVLNLFGISDGNQNSNESYTFDVTFNAVADGLSIDPTLTFGKAFDWVDLKLNANMEDVDGSEKMHLEIDGLDAVAQFRLSDGSSVTSSYNGSTWTLEDIEYDQINNIQLLHSHGVDTVTVNAWTVENANNDTSTPTADATFKLSLNAVSNSLTLPSGAGIDFDKVDNLSALNGVNEIDLSANGANTLENISLQDVIDMTSSSNDLVIKGDGADTVTFTGNNWSKVAGTGGDAGYDIYSNSGDNTVSVKVQTAIDDSIV